MRSLRRRIEALERALAVRGQDGQAVGEQALEWLSRAQLEALISAGGAEREGRPLSVSEMAARQAYAETVQRHGRGLGLGLAAAPLGAPILRQAIIMVLVQQLSSEEFDLVRDAYQAAAQGGELSAAEYAALQAYTATLQRLCQQAGFASMAEMEPSGSGTEIAGGFRR
jgi:hypothetical protein